MAGRCPPQHSRRRNLRPAHARDGQRTRIAHVLRSAARTGAALALDDRKLAPPVLAPGLVRRGALVNRLVGSHWTRCVSIAAPAGYGKTIVLVQWAARDPRPFAWVTVDPRDDDPAHLLTHVAAAVERALGLAPGALRPPATAGFRHAPPSALRRAIAAAEQGLVLVLDDVHELASPEARAMVASLAEHLPAGAQVVLSGRSGVLPVARWRASRQLFELGAADLALTRREADALLHAAGLEVGDEVAARLHEHSEGWAAGLYLAALTLLAAGPGSEQDVVSGTDPYIAEYLREEHFGRRSGLERVFLSRSSVLDSLTGPLCDGVLGCDGSERLLEELAPDDAFLVPLRRPGPGYRHHRLVREFLRGELDRAEPGRAAVLAGQAADWCEAHGEGERAIAYALAAGDVEHAARLVGALAAPIVHRGEVGIEILLAAVADTAVLDRYPVVALHGAWLHALRGQPEAATRWAAAVERARLDDPAPDGSPSLRPWAEVLRGAMCQDGAEHVRAHAESALAELAPLSSYRPAALLVLAGGHVLDGDDEAALDVLDAAVDAATSAGAVHAWIVALAQRALLRMARGDHVRAEDDVREARALADVDGPGDHIEDAILHAAGARLALLRANTRRAHQELERADRMRPFLSHALPWFSVGVLLELAHARLALGEVSAARELLADADEIARRRPSLGAVRARADALAARPRRRWRPPARTAAGLPR